MPRGGQSDESVSGNTNVFRHSAPLRSPLTFPFTGRPLLVTTPTPQGFFRASYIRILSNPMRRLGAGRVEGYLG
jgi:hypothetical protein